MVNVYKDERGYYYLIKLFKFNEKLNKVELVDKKIYIAL